MEKIIRIVSVLFMLFATTTVIASDSYQTTPDDIIITPSVYKTAWKIPARMREYILRMGSLTMQVYKRAPFKLKNPHRFTSRRPVYGTISKWKTPSFNSIPFVIDESKGAGKGYDLIYIDANRDGNFSDKYKLDWRFTASTKFETRVKVPIKLLFPNSDNPNLIEIDITLENGTVGDVSFYGFWEGEVKTNKGMIKFALRMQMQMADTETPGRISARATGSTFSGHRKIQQETLSMAHGTASILSLGSV